MLLATNCRYRGGMAAQGWYEDPFGQYADRWFSAGRPTQLVRDAGAEAFDIPPAGTYDGPLVACASEPNTDGSDLRRADSNWAPLDPRALSDAAMDTVAQLGIGKS
jgi:hypothetical protein